MGFFEFLVKDIETKDAHSNKELRTHYYKAEYKKVKEEVMRYLNENKFKVANVNDNYGEILVEESSFHMIISIKKFTVLETAVDIKISSYGLIGGYRPHKRIKAMYEVLDKQLRFIGIGLHP